VTCVAVKKQFDQRVYDNKKISSDKTATKISISRQKKRWKYGLRLNKTYDGNQKLISFFITYKFIEITLLHG
jgi:hypothetical protein